MPTGESQNRRAFLASMISAAAASTVLVSTADAAIPNDAVYLYRMLGGIQVGEPFFEDWDLIDAYPPRAGGVVLVISQGKSDPIRVDVVRRGNPTRAPAYTQHLELFVMDGGGGVREMPIDLIRALEVLADELQDNEAQYYLAEGLLTHRERLSQYADFMGRAAKELTPGKP